MKMELVNFFLSEISVIIETSDDSMYRKCDAIFVRSLKLFFAH